MAAPEPIVNLAKENGLVYVNDNDLPGITRKKSGQGFAYFSPEGSRITRGPVLDRIRALAIPPAYTKVWICPFEDGHIQATGRDARGRKQYRYHPKWIELSNGNKFNRMTQFGSALPKIRKRVDAALRRPGVPKEKACATVLWLLENSLIRVGNEEYAKQNKSYGLTTMRMRHLNIEGSRIEFKFKGKRGIEHLIRVTDRRMARILRQISELPGQELFHYLDESGKVQTLSSSDVNAYLREISGMDFTAKDFRTWAATVQALTQLGDTCGFKSKRQARAAVKDAYSIISKLLGNTPAICKKSYVHPALVASFLDGSLERFLTKRKGRDDSPEAVLLDFLKEVEDNSELRNLERAVEAMRAEKSRAA